MDVNEMYEEVVKQMNKHVNSDDPAFDLVCALQDLFGHMRATNEIPTKLLD